MSCPDIDSSGKLLVVNPKDHESIEPSGSMIRGGTSISLGYLTSALKMYSDRDHRPMTCTCRYK
jgi:hypothetical protein